MVTRGAHDSLDDSAGLDFPAADLAEWRKLAEADLGPGGAALFEKKLVTRTYEGLTIRPLYTRADWAAGASGLAGASPFTRGSTTLPHAWDLRQERTEPTSALVNAALLEDLSGGVSSVLLRYDAAGRLGLDADDRRAGLLAGVDGCALSSPADLADAFKGVYLNMIGVMLEPGAAFVPAAAHLAALWEARNVKASEARGCFGADPLAVLAREGHLPCTLEDALTQLADLAAWTSARYPAVRAVRVGTAAYHHAGATAAQDLAFALATGVEYVRAMSARGLAIDAAAGQMLFSFAMGTNFFLGMAKLRAARRLWARVLEACGASEGARAMTMHVRPSKRVMSARDPWVNILRNTVAVFAAGVGGADAISSLPLDVALRGDTGASSALARRIARNTPLILQEESHLHRILDLPGGSWFIESLTDDLAAKAWKLFQELERAGGMARALKDGLVQSWIDQTAAERDRNIATRRDPILGVSEFPRVEGDAVPAVEQVSPERARHEAVARLAEYRKQASRVGEPREGLSISEWAFHAAKQGATLGAIALGVGLGAGGIASVPRAVGLHPFAEPFERLRDAAERYADACGVRPRVFLASIGSPAEHLARTNYAKNFFEAGGFDAPIVGSGDGYPDAASAARAFAESGATIAVICSTDKRYPTLVPELAPLLHRAGANRVVLAGNPGEQEAAFRAAGVDRFIYVRCDVVRTLRELLAEVTLDASLESAGMGSSVGHVPSTEGAAR